MQMQFGAFADNLNVLEPVQSTAQRADDVREAPVSSDVGTFAACRYTSNDRISHVDAGKCVDHLICSPDGCINPTILEIEDVSGNL